MKQFSKELPRLPLILFMVMKNWDPNTRLLELEMTKLLLLFVQIGDIKRV
jgi:hypothetical protein